MAVSNINDEELRTQLVNAGHKVGPITNSTRGVYLSLLKKVIQDEIRMNAPIPVEDPEETPARRTTLKRGLLDIHDGPEVADKKKKEEEFIPTTPSHSKIPVKSGIPTYQAPALRRSTIEKTALSHKLAAEKSLMKETLKKNTLGAVSKGLTNSNKVNIEASASGTRTPHYMRGTTASIKKVGVSSSTIPKGGISRGSKTDDERSNKENDIPRVGSSAINKAKDKAGNTGPTGKAKKKRPAWDVKGRLEDVTLLYNEIKDEKLELEDKLVNIQEDLLQSTSELELIRSERDQLVADLTTTRASLESIERQMSEMKTALEDAVQERDAKVSSFNRIKRDHVELEEDYQKIKSKLREADNQVDDLERDVRKLRKAQEEIEETLEKSRKQCAQLEAEVKELKETVDTKTKTILDLEKKLDSERGEKGDVYYTLRRKEDTIKDLQSKNEELEKTCRELKDTVHQRDQTIAGLEGSLTDEKYQHRNVNQILDDRNRTIKEQEKKLADCLDKLHAGEILRRKLHNTIQELKGNIRVYCRVRPYLPDEVMTGQPVTDIPHMEFSKDASGLIVSYTAAEKLGRRGENVKNDFSFDHVFGPHHRQEDTFEEVSGLVQSALDGYNVCIFAYGQTGSGKTHTMQGPTDPSSEHRGIIPRSMEQIFETGDKMLVDGWEYKFTASFLEIYNETLHDLIGSGSEKIEIKLVNEKTRDVEVTNVKNVQVRNTYDVHQLLLKANKNRSVAATKCNERSSRSHSVFRLKIEGTNTRNGEGVVGNLNLVDLAGSERVAHSGSTGQRLKEAQAINNSLAELGNVIMALNERKPHVPYRNSKLTYLLCNSLGGNSKTLMFVNVNPLEKHLSETINSLRFATKVNRTDLGTAKKNKC